MRVYALLVAAAAVAPVLADGSTNAVGAVQSVIDNTTSSSQATTGSSSSLPTVKLHYATVQAVGGNTTVGYYKYQNIRFAKVPTGDLRFAAPEWPDVETAINTGTNLAGADVDCKTSEDCLYVDVWAPADAVGRNLPVMVWTYGGGFTGGSKSEVTPEGLFDLSTNFVYVAYNYKVPRTPTRVVHPATSPSTGCNPCGDVASEAFPHHSGAHPAHQEEQEVVDPPRDLDATQERFDAVWRRLDEVQHFRHWTTDSLDRVWDDYNDLDRRLADQNGDLRFVSERMTALELGRIHLLDELRGQADRVTTLEQDL